MTALVTVIIVCVWSFFNMVERKIRRFLEKMRQESTALPKVVEIPRDPPRGPEIINVIRPFVNELEDRDDWLPGDHTPHTS